MFGITGARDRKTPAPRLLARRIAEARTAERIGVRPRRVFCEEAPRHLATSRRTCG